MINRLANVLAYAVLICFGVEVSLHAEFIDFDTDPGSGNVWLDSQEGTQISSTTWASQGVTMGFVSPFGGGPIPSNMYMSLSKEGAPRTAFRSVTYGDDTTRPGDVSGGWFITNDVGVNESPDNFYMIFDQSMMSVSMAILDIDRFENFEVTAYQYNPDPTQRDIILGTQNLSVATTGDGEAQSTFFSFDYKSAQIDYLIIDENGTSNEVGFAFDRLFFSPAPIPEPGSMCLMACALTGMGLIRRRKKPVVGE